MKAEHPILFSTAMVKTILAGRKTITRRIIKESFNGCMTHGQHPCPNDPVVLTPGEVLQSPVDDNEVITIDYPEVRAIFHCSTLDAEVKCPFGKVGDLLWVRESWAKSVTPDGLHRCEIFKVSADGKTVYGNEFKWKPSIHMKKEVARIWLEVTDIRVEELHDITEEDAIKEGVEEMFFGTKGVGVMTGEHTGWRNYTPKKDYDKRLPFLNKQFAKQSFESLWRAINGNESWEQNPWIWKVSFKVLSTTGRP